jgi:hypothetical protein
MALKETVSTLLGMTDPLAHAVEVLEMKAEIARDIVVIKRLITKAKKEQHIENFKYFSTILEDYELEFNEVGL